MFNNEELKIIRNAMLLDLEVSKISKKFVFAAYKSFMLGKRASKVKENFEEFSKKTKEQIILKYGSKKQKRPIRRKLKKLKWKLNKYLKQQGG